MYKEMKKIQTGNRSLINPFQLNAYATKNILDGRKDRGKTVYPPPPSGSGGIIKISD
jgi:hypothetical protein